LFKVGRRGKLNDDSHAPRSPVSELGVDLARFRLEIILFGFFFAEPRIYAVKRCYHIGKEDFVFSKRHGNTTLESQLSKQLGGETHGGVTGNCVPFRY
jgi:hypothetical protein